MSSIRDTSLRSSLSVRDSVTRESEMTKTAIAVAKMHGSEVSTLFPREIAADPLRLVSATTAQGRERNGRGLGHERQRQNVGEERGTKACERDGERDGERAAARVCVCVYAWLYLCAYAPCIRERKRRVERSKRRGRAKERGKRGNNAKRPGSPRDEPALFLSLLSIHPFIYSTIHLTLSFSITLMLFLSVLFRFTGLESAKDSRGFVFAYLRR